MEIPTWGLVVGGVAVGGGAYLYHKKKAAASAAAQQQNQSQTQAAPITTIPYAVGLNYGNGYAGGGRHGATGATGPQGPPGPAGPAGTTATATATTGTGTVVTGTHDHHHQPVVSPWLFGFLSSGGAGGGPLLGAPITVPLSQATPAELRGAGF